MLRHAMVSDKPGDLRVQRPPPPGKLAVQLKSPFGDSCYRTETSIMSDRCKLVTLTSLFTVSAVVLTGMAPFFVTLKGMMVLKLTIPPSLLILSASNSVVACKSSSSASVEIYAKITSTAVTFDQDNS